MKAQAKKRIRHRRQNEYLPADFEEFVEWVNSLSISRGAKRTIITGVKKAFLMGLYTLEDVKALPKGTKGKKSMRYGMSKYEEFLLEKNVFS